MIIGIFKEDVIIKDLNSILKLVSELQEEVRQLRLENAQLRMENAQLKKRIKELEAKIKQNSHNSHLPPSSDRFTKKIRSAFTRNQNKKTGGQKGHEGNTLDKVDYVDEIIVVSPQQCQCGTNLFTVNGDIAETRQEFDIPPVEIYTKEYQMKECICPRCKKLNRGTFPSHIVAPTQYGSAIKSLCVVLSVNYKVPLAKIVQMMDDMYKVKINESSIINWLKQAYNLLETTEDQIKEYLINSKLVHADETGIKINGQIYWNHVTSNEKLTHQFVHEKRGQQAIRDGTSILPYYKGILVHDCWSSYFTLDQVRHAICGAHLLRELYALIENGSKWAIRFQEYYLNLYNSSQSKNKRNKNQILITYDKIIKQGTREEPPPERTGSRGRLKNSKGLNLINRLIDYKDAVLGFAFDSLIPFTNNQGERDIRHCKTKQKVSGCFRSIEGAKYYMRISSVTITLRKNSLNVLDCFKTLFTKGNYSLSLT